MFVNQTDIKSAEHSLKSGQLNDCLIMPITLLTLCVIYLMCWRAEFEIGSNQNSQITFFIASI